MDGLLKGLAKVVLETILLAGGEKEVWTGCGKLGGSATCNEAVPSCACIEGESGASSGDVLLVPRVWDEDGIGKAWSVGAALVDVETFVGTLLPAACDASDDDSDDGDAATVAALASVSLCSDITITAAREKIPM